MMDTEGIQRKSDQRPRKLAVETNRSAEKEAIIVLGMHRSGTSAIARLVNLLGVSLPEKVLGPGPGNLAGHWEPERLMLFNHELMKELDVNWYDWTPPNWSNYKKSDLIRIKQGWKSVITREYGENRQILIKEPRLARLANPFLDAVRDLGYRPVVIVALRNPLDVVSSLLRRDNWPDHHGRGDAALLWLSYMLESERAARSLPHIFVSYEEIMQDPLTAVTSLSERLQWHGIKFAREPNEISEDIRAFINHELRHGASTAEEIALDPQLAGWVADAYAAFRTMKAKRSKKAARATLDRIHTEFSSTRPFLQAFADEQREALKSAAHENKDLKALQEKQAQELTKKSKETKKSLDRVQTEREMLSDMVKNVKNELKVAEATLAELKAHSQDLSKRLNSHHDKAIQQQRKIQALEKQLHNAEAERDELQDQKGQMVDQLARTNALHFATSVAYQRATQKSVTARLIAALSIRRRLKLRAQRRAIKSSGLFDESWYLSQNPDVKGSKMEPLTHFLEFGFLEGRNPSQYFDISHYLRTYPDIAAAGATVNPLVHYIQVGAREGRRPNPDAKALPREIQVNSMRTVGGLRASVGKLVRRSGLMGESEIEKRAGHLRRFIEYAEQPHGLAVEAFDPQRMKISWVIPDFLPGAGGHMTIFRIASHLERFGHDVRIFIQNPSVHASGEQARETINQHFQPFLGQVELFTDLAPEVSGDALIATDRFTTYPVNAMGGFRRKFYFVQDYETRFYPSGSESLLTEATYEFDFDCLCAGEWLEHLMRERFGRWAISWPLAFDDTVYNLDDNVSRKRNHIAFYARYATPRRAVELGFMALQVLHERGLDFHVDFFGWDLGKLSVPYAFTDHGVLSSNELAQLYRESSVGVVFSATNHSLVNKEMMASGLPVLDLDLETTRAIFPEDAMEFAAPTVAGIADALQRMLESPDHRKSLRNAGLAYINHLSWEASSRKVESVIRGRLGAGEKATSLNE